MTVLVIAEVSGPLEEFDALKHAVDALAQASRREEGCLTYRPFEDQEQSGCLVILEKWASRSALDAHGKSAHMAQFKASLSDKISVSVEKHDI
ncbi:antibiotic biosynthesis monooxygenase [Shimia sp. R10_1]|uniref:putative quinol monooxygenase n=1 Tax=Shimia sp. R10_1 TaxID=2821095 RepID=UPI001AD99E75|nr:putative quinol monooxygenase [Shimia sp. R10_1]MBO9475232.1 antibiotic biosynthesis monooxygenase [Shimia sp. R10_1]